MRSFFSRKLTSCFILANFVCLCMAAQNTNSPYSVYGIGDIDNDSYNRTSGMGGAGLAIKSGVFLIDNNPAALAGMSKSFYIASLAATGKTFSFTGAPINSTNSNSKDFWIKRFTFAIKLNNIWASSFGFNQFSNVNYSFTGSKFIEGSTDSYAAGYQGDGGLNEYHFTNAVALGKHLSLGIKSSLIAGSINQNETVTEANTATSIVTNQQDYISHSRFQGGLQYDHLITKKWGIAIGAKYSPKTKFSADRTLTVTENAVQVVSNRYIKSDRFYLPETFAGGIAVKYNNSTTFAADYTYEDWSSLHIKDQGWQLISSNRISAGVEFSKHKVDHGFYVENNFFQVGGFINNSYLQIRNTPINEWGATVGMGGSLRNSFLYTLSLEGGIRGTTQQMLIKETFVGFKLSLSYRDFIYSKGKRYD